MRKMASSVTWAPFLSEPELRVFLTLVEAEIKTLGVPYRLGDGLVDVDLDEGTQSLGLSNLAQVCARLPAAEWPRAVAKHFSLVVGSTAEEARLRSVVHDFEAVRSMLRPRLYEAWLEDQVVHGITEGLVASIVFDLDNAMRSISRAEAEPWNKSDREIFEAALENLDREEAPRRETIRGPEDVPIVVAEGPSYYTASLALRLEKDVVPAGHPYGALLVVPARHVFFYHLIEDNRVMLAVNALVSLATEAFKRGPGSISERVFWVHEGVYRALPWSVDEGTLFVTPPSAFIREVLERVAKPPS